MNKEIISIIDNANTRWEVEKAIKLLKKEELFEIAQYYSIWHNKSITKKELIMRIVEGTVGSKLRFELLLGRR